MSVHLPPSPASCLLNRRTRCPAGRRVSPGTLCLPLVMDRVPAGGCCWCGWPPSCSWWPGVGQLCTQGSGGSRGRGPFSLSGSPLRPLPAQWEARYVLVWVWGSDSFVSVGLPGERCQSVTARFTLATRCWKGPCSGTPTWSGPSPCKQGWPRAQMTLL